MVLVRVSNGLCCLVKYDLPLATDDSVAEGAGLLISSNTVDELVDTKVQKTLSSKQVRAEGVVWKPDAVDGRSSRGSSRSSKGELHDEDLEVKIDEGRFKRVDDRAVNACGTPVFMKQKSWVFC